MKSDFKSFISKYVDGELFIRVFIFGSVARGVKTPNDCDLFLVTSAKADTADWKFLKELIIEMKIEFKSHFDLNLNVCLNTKTEYLEGSEFKSRIHNRPMILLKNGIQHFV